MKLLLKAAFKTSRRMVLLITAAVCLLLLSLADSLEMFTLGVLTNQGGKNPLQFILAKLSPYIDLSGQSIQAVIVLLVIVAIFKACALFFSRYTAQLFYIRVSRDLREEYFRHIQKLPMRFYHDYNIGTISARIAADAYQIAYSINSMITNYIQAPFTFILSFSSCCYLSWKLTVVIFLSVPLIIIPIIIVTRKVKRITRQWMKNQERFSSILIDFLAGIQTVKVFGMEAFSFRKYQEQNDEMARLEAKTAKYDLLTRPILHTITTICVAIVAIYGLYFLKLSLADLLVFCGLLYLAYEPIKKFAEENVNIQLGVVAAERLYEVLHLDPSENNKMGEIEIKAFNETLAFENVWFKYNDRWVLKDVSFEVKKGETVAIVGATGAGKSTIVQLIPRLYDVDQGRITIDGLPLQAYTKTSLRRLLAFVPQKPFLFLDTVAANITVGEDYTEEEMHIAASKAHAADFIDPLPCRYDTLLSEMGKNLSGGQQQRLAIARALIRNAPLLILDEATSSLDAISERKIKDAIDNLHGKVTQIIIAHRLTTVENADRIIFIEDGCKIGDAPPAELIETCQPFRHMWEAFKRTEPVARF